MSMVLIGHRLSAEQSQVLLDDPSAVDRLLYGDLDDEDAEMPEPNLDLGKAWHAIHYLLTGTAWEIGEGAGAAILGGDDIGDDNVYGRRRLLSPDVVRVVSAGLDRLGPETLRARFDPLAMAAADIYPTIWST